MYRGVKRVSWTNWDEWEETYRYLYSQNTSEVIEGCNKVLVWRAKNLIPIAVEVTAFIQKELHTTKNLLGLCLGIVRFINGVVEPFFNYQFDKSIKDIGTSLGLPEFIITLRHSITHGKLPTFEFAQLAAELSLSWLEEKYWIPQLQRIQQYRDEMHKSLMDFFLESIEPFSSFNSNVIDTFGVQELVKIMINENLNVNNLDDSFVDKVIAILTTTDQEHTYFSANVGMSLAEEMATGNSLAALWLEKLSSVGLIPYRSVALILSFANPMTLKRAHPNRILEILVEKKGEDGKVNCEEENPRWPPIAIGRSPLDIVPLTLSDDEWEYADESSEIKSSKSIETEVINTNMQEIPKADQSKETSCFQDDGDIEIW